MHWPDGRRSGHVGFQSASYGQEAEVCYSEAKVGNGERWAIARLESKQELFNFVFMLDLQVKGI